MTSTINASTTAGIVTTADTSGVLALQTAGTTAVTVDASQNVGIGTSSPQSLLDVTGNDPTIRLTDNGGSPIATFSMRSADATYRIRDVTNSTDRLTINANGAVALSGASVSATGTGITFPATQSASSDANTLDDYEEGTWTPVFAGNSPAGSATYSSQIGTYTKIGNMVNVRFQLVATSGITGGGGVTLIRGLPFNPGGSNQNGGGGSITIWSGFATGINTSNLYVDASNNYLVPYYAGSFTATSGSYWGTTTVIQNTSSVAGVATYYV